MSPELLLHFQKAIEKTLMTIDPKLGQPNRQRICNESSWASVTFPEAMEKKLGHDVCQLVLKKRHTTILHTSMQIAERNLVHNNKTIWRKTWIAWYCTNLMRASITHTKCQTVTFFFWKRFLWRKDEMKKNLGWGEEEFSSEMVEAAAAALYQLRTLQRDRRLAKFLLPTKFPVNCSSENALNPKPPLAYKASLT
jgi:hypothetical protein